MSPVRQLVVVLAVAAMMASGTLHAQVRGQAPSRARSDEKQLERLRPVLDQATRARRITEMQDWLERLVGQFHGEARTFGNRMEQVLSAADCSGIGKGAGVRCIVRMALPGQTELSGSLPIILYFGIDTDAMEVQLVTVDPGQVGGRSGMLAGDTVDFSNDNWKVCHKVPFGICWVVAEITAKPAGELFMTFAFDSWLQGSKLQSAARPGHSGHFEFQLHRVQPADAESPPNSR